MARTILLKYIRTITTSSSSSTPRTARRSSRTLNLVHIDGLELSAQAVVTSGLQLLFAGLGTTHTDIVDGSDVSAAFPGHRRQQDFAEDDSLEPRAPGSNMTSRLAMIRRVRGTPMGLYPRREGGTGRSTMADRAEAAGSSGCARRHRAHAVGHLYLGQEPDERALL